MVFVLFFHVVCKISNFNIGTAKQLAQASCTELALLLKMFDPVVQTMVRNSIWHVTNLSFLASIFPSVTTTQNLAMEN